MPTVKIPFSKFCQAVAQAIDANSEELTQLDQAIGDGDHVSNLQRGLQTLSAQSDTIAQMDWSDAFQKMGMTIMATVGGASGSLYGTLFIALGKGLQDQPWSAAAFADALKKAVEAVKRRGKADRGEKTMLDVLIPVAEVLHKHVGLPDCYLQIKETAEIGVESTRDMLATKGRASFLGKRSLGHLDAGAKSAQVMICAIVDELTAPS
jgi:phosphoenolpyruvate---glycerone phosphotransferase subunit DhaL